MKKIEGVCKVDGCGRSLKARGYCNTHYAQFKRNGDITEVVIRTRVMVHPETCTIPNCAEPVKARSLCDKHYMRLLRHGYVKNPDRTKPFEACMFPGCTDHRVCSGCCNRHYLKIRKYQQDHGLTLDQTLELIHAMPDKCQLCRGRQTTRNGKSRRYHDFYLDHDHETGRLRGWLCNNCNRALGYLRADRGVGLLVRAMEYVKTATLPIQPPPIE